MFSGRKNKISIFIGGSKQSAEWDSERLNEMIIGERDNFNKIFDKDPAILNPETQKIVDYPGGHVEGFPDAFKNHFQHFYDSMDHPDRIHEYATFSDGLQEMRVIEAIFESSKTRRWVKVN